MPKLGVAAKLRRGILAANNEPVGYFDTFTATLFRTDAAGRRVIAPFGSWGTVRLVSDQAAGRIAAAVRIYYLVSLAVMIGTQIIAGWRWNVFLMAPLCLLTYFLLLGFLIRPLPRLEMSARDLPKISRRALLESSARATGSRLLWLLAASSAVMAGLSFWVGLWWGGAFFALCTAVFALQLWLIRNSSRAP